MEGLSATCYPGRSFMSSTHHHTTSHSLSKTDQLQGPRSVGGDLHLSSAAEIQAFHAAAKVAAEEFKASYKEAGGKEPKLDRIVSPEQEGLINEWLATPEGIQKISTLSDRVISFVTEAVGRGHPGHDMRHVLYKDPISGLRIAMEEELSPAQELFIIPSLLHDVGRLFEPLLFDKPQSGTLGVDHTILGFAITQSLLGDCLTTESSNPELAVALKNLHDEILNAVLDHQSGNSKRSAMAQFVQRADREQLVGYEALHRFLSFDVGFYGLQIKGAPDQALNTKLPLPGTAEDNHLFVHAEFYMRNLFANQGKRADEHTDIGKIQTGRFLLLAATPRMRRQIFDPELRRDLGDEVDTEGTKRLLSEEVWNEIAAFTTPQLINRLDVLRGEKTLQDLAKEFVHPLHATRTDFGSYSNWAQISEKLQVLDSQEDRYFGRALMYGLTLAEEVEKEDRAIVSAALMQYARDDNNLMYKVAKLVAGLQDNQGH